MYILSDGATYIGVDSLNSATRVTDVSKAKQFVDEEKANNYKKNLKASLQKSKWCIIPVTNSIEENYIYEETEIERSDLDIYDFFKKTINTVSQLRTYANNMDYMEKQYNQKILDIRHYKRDKRTKLSAIQLQRLEQFEIQIERERYQCKSNRMIAEIFLADLNRLENTKYLEVIKNINESEYKPKVFTFEMLDGIVGKKTLKNSAV